MNDLDLAILDLEIALICHEQELSDAYCDLLHEQEMASRK